MTEDNKSDNGDGGSGGDALFLVRVHAGRRAAALALGKLIFVVEYGSADGDIRDTTLRKHTDIIRCAAFDHLGEHLFTSGDDKEIIVWETRNWSFLCSRRMPKKISSLAVTRDGKYVIVGVIITGR